MTRSELVKEIYKKKSFLCVGLDTDITKIPKHLLDTEDPIFEFNKAIIDATQEFAVAFKPNTAFYEAHGIQGWQSLQKTMDYISKSIFTIADAKRGDIGNTSSMYAEAFFNKEKSGFDFDSVTVAPYMGSDSVIPFLKFPNKWVILLGLTSNEGSINFQQKELKNNNLLFEDVLKTSQSWGDENNMMYVIGATKATELQNIRKIIPNHFLLVPGVGAQGGSLKEVSENGLNKECGLLVNSSRGIIYAGSDIHFAEKAQEEAKKLAKEMSEFL